MADGLEQLRELLGELYRLGSQEAPPPEGPTPISGERSEAISVPDVLLGLGYLVAIQERPQVAPVLTAGAGKAALEVLESVVKQWLSGLSATRPGPEVVGYYQRAGEHLRKLGRRPQASSQAGEDLGQSERI